jgi:hypothetical protein
MEEMCDVALAYFCSKASMSFLEGAEEDMKSSTDSVWHQQSPQIVDK